MAGELSRLTYTPWHLHNQPRFSVCRKSASACQSCHSRYSHSFFPYQHQALTRNQAEEEMSQTKCCLLAALRDWSEALLRYSSCLPAGCHHSLYFQLYNHDIILYIYISQHLLKTLSASLTAFTENTLSHSAGYSRGEWRLDGENCCCWTVNCSNMHLFFCALSGICPPNFGIRNWTTSIVQQCSGLGKTYIATDWLLKWWKLHLLSLLQKPVALITLDILTNQPVTFSKWCSSQSEELCRLTPAEDQVLWGSPNNRNQTEVDL